MASREVGMCPLTMQESGAIRADSRVLFAGLSPAGPADYVSAPFPRGSPMKVSFTVNGQPRSVDAPGDMPLLWTLRDTLNLKGTKFGCGAELCGACTVHLNGGTVRSCSVPMSAVQNAKITTIEGLSPDGTHALQRAWEELDVPQCGYCQAGQIMAAAELLGKHPNPTDEQI